MKNKKELGTVRIKIELIPPLRKLVDEATDEFGSPKYSSMAAAVSEAVKQLLRQHKKPVEVTAR